MILNTLHRNRNVFFLLAACLAVLPMLAAASRANAVEFQGQVLDYRAKQIYHSPETPGYTAWTGLWKLPNGTIQCDFVQATGPLSNPTFTYPVLQSTDSGQTWTRTLTDVPSGWTRGMALLPNGTMVRPDATGLHFDATGHLNYPNNNFMGVQRSTDGGVTWSSSINLVSPGDYQNCLPLVIKPLSDGRLVAMAGLTASSVPADKVSQNMAKAMFVSSDQGQTWGEPIPLMTLAQGICEESDFVELPNGDLFFMHRLQHYDANGKYLSQDRRQSTVKKVGDTFVPQTPTTPPWSGQGFPCELLTREGILLDMDLFGSHWSDDLGQTWHNLKVDGQQLKTYYYPQAVQAADGTIVVTSHVRWDDAYGTIDESIKLQTFRLTPNEVPEPSALTLLGTGFLAFLAFLWRRHKRAV